MMPNTVRLHRLLATKPEKVYRAFIEADALAKWFPPNGFACTMHQLEAKIFSAVYLYNDNDDRLRIAAIHNFSPQATTQILQGRQNRRPDRSNLAGRAILDRAIIHVHDVLTDPEYSREWALAGGWRAVLALPLLRDGKPVGALSVAKVEPIPFSIAEHLRRSGGDCD